jgi:hypothetical protein
MDSPVFPFLNIAESNKFISQAASDIFGSSFVVTPKTSFSTVTYAKAMYCQNKSKAT